MPTEVRMTIPAGLDVPDAPALRDGLVATLAQARETKAVVSLALDGGSDPTAPALQLLIAAHRALLRDGVAVEIDPAAAAALDTVEPTRV
jgi:hypothetical protein